MIYTQESFTFPCSCGKEHRILSGGIVIEGGALRDWREHAAAFGLETAGEALRNTVAVYDQNTYRATEGRRPSGVTEIVLDPVGLHADELATARVLHLLGERAPRAHLLWAVGAGTVHDITRYCAAELGIPFISVPTAASVDGFASTVAAMTWHGYKKTVPAVAPALVLADLDIISRAPMRLTRSGMGDLLGKYICLADWKISHLLTGEYYCEGIAGLTREAVQVAVESSAGLSTGSPQAYERLTFGLILSGIAMQLTGNSRPASGAEHHISHAVELGLCGPNDALHGEKVGVGTLLCAQAYRLFARLPGEALPARRHPYHSPQRDVLEPVFGPLTESVLDENKADCLEAVSSTALLGQWDAVRRELRTIPTEQELKMLYNRLGLKRSLEEIGVANAEREKLLYWSPFVRNRLTFMRALHLLVENPAGIRQ